MVNAFEIHVGVRPIVLLALFHFLYGAAVTEVCQGQDDVCPAKSRRGAAMLQLQPAHTETVVAVSPDAFSVVALEESSEEIDSRVLQKPASRSHASASSHVSRKRVTRSSGKSSDKSSGAKDQVQENQTESTAEISVSIPPVTSNLSNARHVPFLPVPMVFAGAEAKILDE
eukprot:TRINITY_DN76806_c0_g1_i1.p2 TRINITY_DN76806_c0_g1~~TRINITY_DN76806_c0_g1_i1.p2  ORF type:complete len:171 (+),score=21.06 TRINITY_DN76806_c0_g1_i1:86-598(+)